MRTLCPALLCALVLTACSAEIAVDTPPTSVQVPITSFVQKVYAEVAVDLPEETQGLDITVNSISGDVIVVNPSKSLTLTTTARLSFSGSATPDQPQIFTQATLPPYYASAVELLAETSFAPGSRTPKTIAHPELAKVIGKKRIWLIVSNTVTNGLPTALPLEIQLENIVLHAVVTKSFGGLEGALSIGGL